MKGKIDKNGVLHLERSGEFQKQICPFTVDGYCCDWCPLFGNPKVSKWMGSPDPEGDSPHWDLRLCRITLYFKEFTDER